MLGGRGRPEGEAGQILPVNEVGEEVEEEAEEVAGGGPDDEGDGAKGEEVDIGMLFDEDHGDGGDEGTEKGACGIGAGSAKGEEADPTEATADDADEDAEHIPEGSEVFERSHVEGDAGAEDAAEDGDALGEPELFAVGTLLSPNGVEVPCHDGGGGIHGGIEGGHGGGEESGNDEAGEADG